MDRPRTVLAAAIVTLLALSVLFVRPFLNYFLLAVLLAFVLRPVQSRLAPRVGEGVAAASIVLFATIALLLPTAYVAVLAFEEGLTLVRSIRAGGAGLEPIETLISDVTGVEVDITQFFSDLVSDMGIGALDSALSIVGTAAHVLIGLGLVLFLLYYFLRDGDRFVDWFEKRAPLTDRVRSELFGEIRRITRAVLVGHVFVALVQGFIAGVGLLVFGVPNAFFWTIVMMVLAILPIIGSFLVWGPAVAWLVLSGRPIAGLALLLYGTIVVGVSDDYLRPIVVDRYAHVNPATIIIGVLGGIYVIGFMGIFFGPVVIGVLKASIDVYVEEVQSQD